MLKRPTKSRLHLRSIENAPAPVDKEIAELFREMRQATGHTVHEIADKLKTPFKTINALEEGDLSSLPDWNETGRVIYEYTNILNLDPEPVMRRVMVQLPANHPKRPRTQVREPSYDNVRANADAVMNRVPGSQTAVENPSLSMQHDYTAQSSYQRDPSPQAQQYGGNGNVPPGGFPEPASANPRAEFTPGYGDMRAIPHSLTLPASQRSARMVAKKPKSSVFVPLVQFLLLLIILGTGYSMWLAVNDPQGYEELKSLALSNWEIVREQSEALKTFLFKQLDFL